MATTTRLVTVEDVAALPDDTNRYDLIEGELYRMAAAGAKHGEATVEILTAVALFVRPQNLGRVYTPDTGFVLARHPDTLLCPDVAFVRTERLPPDEARRGFLELAPDLAVEVISPSDRAREVAAKVRLYLDAGVRLVWTVHPEARTVTVWPPDAAPRTDTAAEDLDGGDVLPGFRLPVAAIFA